MSAANLQLAKMAVDNLSARDRQVLIREWTGQPALVEPDRIIRLRSAADRMGCGVRTIHNLFKTGVLTRVVLPGRTRALGIRNSEIDAIISAGGAK